LLEGTSWHALLKGAAKQKLQFSQNLRALVWVSSLIAICL